MSLRNLVLALVLVGASFSGTIQAAESKVVRIGSFLALTGPASFLGDPELKTLKMLVERINEDGGVAGYTLELIHYDSGADAAKARTFAKRLLMSDEVDVVIGGSTTGVTMAVVPLMERTRTPFISLASGVPIVKPVKPWVFKTPHTDRMVARRVLTHMKSRRIERFALLSATTGFGQSGREQTLAIADELGLEVVADETYSPDDTSMVVQLTSIRNTAGVQAVFVFGAGQGPAIVTKNYRQLGIELPLYQSHGVASKRFIELAGGAAEGVILPAAALLVAEQLPEDDPQRPVVVGYKHAYESRWNEPVSAFGGNAYDAMLLLADALRRAGSADPEALRRALEKTSGLMGTNGEFNMTPEDHNGLSFKSLKLLKIKDGDWTIID